MFLLKIMIKKKVKFEFVVNRGVSEMKNVLSELLCEEFINGIL